MHTAQKGTLSRTYGSFGGLGASDFPETVQNDRADVKKSAWGARRAVLETAALGQSHARCRRGACKETGPGTMESAVRGI